MFGNKGPKPMLSSLPHAIHLSTVVALLSIQPSHDHPLGANLAKDPVGRRVDKAMESSVQTAVP